MCSSSRFKGRGCHLILPALVAAADNTCNRLVLQLSWCFSGWWLRDHLERPNSEQLRDVHLSKLLLCFAVVACCGGRSAAQYQLQFQNSLQLVFSKHFSFCKQFMQRK